VPSFAALQPLSTTAQPAVIAAGKQARRRRFIGVSSSAERHLSYCRDAVGIGRESACRPIWAFFNQF
jgi:hypothetical protein